MKLDDLLANQKRCAEMYKAIMANTTFPDSTAIGQDNHPEVRKLMLHFNRDDELRCKLLNTAEIEFIGDIFHAVFYNSTYQPTPEVLQAIRQVNLKLSLCSTATN